MWKVGGIEIELAIGQVFLWADTEISEKLIFLLFGQLLGNEERYWDGP